MLQVTHFEIETRDPEGKMQFYEKVFGWKFKHEMDGYWMIDTGENGQERITGAIMQTSGNEALRTLNTIDVPDIHEYLGKIESAGGKVQSDVMPIPGVGLFAYVQDPEGLTFGVVQEDRQ